ncbi:MAG: DNA-3-methyladenine glycosylase 2 family protein [Myxococcales bacterium]|nr:DNA-3-methyladenine glycosylase 2 family protein [Myxococcales bacterium]
MRMQSTNAGSATWESAHERILAVSKTSFPRLHEAITANGMLELPRSPRPLALTLCKSVVGQQLSTKAARTIWGRLVEQAGEAGVLPHFFDASEETLRLCGVSRVKARSLKAIASANQNNQLDDLVAAELSRDETRKRLLALYGVGGWTADMAEIFVFGHLDVWPDADAAARKTLADLTGEQTTAAVAAAFAPFQSLLALHMWTFIDNPPE